MCSPAFVISVKSPAVLRATVFPPVLEPVIKRELYVLPSSKSFSTIFSTFPIKSGCRMACISRIFCSQICAGVDFVRMEYFALAKMKSSSLTIFCTSVNSFFMFKNSFVNSHKIRSISAFISTSIWRILLFIGTNTDGSIK